MGFHGSGSHATLLPNLNPKVKIKLTWKVFGVVLPILTLPRSQLLPWLPDLDHTRVVLALARMYTLSVPTVEPYM